VARDQANGQSGVGFQVQPRFLKDKPPRPEPR
jgi:hypothetical protein